jgi:TonB-dependent receptor
MSFVSRTLFVLCLLVSAAAPGAAQTAGVVQGRVFDAQTGDPLPGADVMLDGTTLSTATDKTGAFRLAGVPSGATTLVIRYLGHEELRLTVEVAPGALTTVPDAKLAKLRYSEFVTVTAEVVKDAQARALNQQRTAANITNVVSADQIGRLPDANAAEATQRIPGVSITKDQGEGRYVLIRGTEPRLNSMMIDGERIPSPDPTLRQVALDVVPSDLLQSIEVSKALTADQDGDAIGGGVNLVMKQAPETFRLFGGIGTGYNQLLDSYAQNSYAFTGGRRFAGRKAGLILSLGGSSTTRGNQDVEVVYNNGALAELDLRYYQVKRRRVGFTGAFDARPSDNTTYTVRGVYNRYIDDHENRQRFRNRVGNRRLERELRDRTHLEHISSLSFNGTHNTSWASIDYRVLGAYSDQKDPLTMTTTFRQSNVNFSPNVTATSIDPNNVQANPLNQDISAYTFNSQVRATNSASDRDIVGAFNLTKPLSTSTRLSTLLKVGGKFRDKARHRARNEVTLTTSARLLLTDYLDPGMTLRPFLGGRYDLTPYVSQAKVATIPDQVAVVSTPNRARDAENYDGTEQVAAAYGMAELFIGPKLLLVPGVRYEHTTANYNGYQVKFSTTGAYLSTNPAKAKSDYGVVLPSAHLKYAVTPDTNLRVALTRSFARPNYYDVVPYESRNDLDNTAKVGNADLKPTTSWNVDVLGEHYFKSVGVVSAGVFYKRLTDYIYVYTYPQAINSLTYQFTQPKNGDAATVRGLELSLQNQLTFLPSPLNGIGVYANYTFAASSASFPQHAGTSRLPGQSRHVGNLAVSYEKFGFQGRAAITFHGSYVDQIGATNVLDRYYDAANQLDFSASQKLARHLRLYVDVLNVNDALLRYYQGTPERVLQEEHYKWWMNFGLKFDF